ncbi:MAG: DUF2232 domain-containing protein [Deltaproteobacteria bacterium]|nr:DUF2232 domain-containing protein [Deltaproteobacteria bacterium]
MASSDGMKGIFGGEVLWAIAMSTLVFLAASATATFISFSVLIIPLPLLYFYSRLGRMRGAAVFLVSLAITMAAGALAEMVLSLRLLVLVGLAGPVLSEVIRRNLSIERTVLGASIVLLGLGVLLVVLDGLSQGVAPWTVFVDGVRTVVDDRIELIKRLGIASEQIQFITRNVDLIVATVLSLLPSFLGVGILFFVWANVLAGRVLFIRKGMWYPDYGDLSRWKLPDNLVWLFIAAAGSLLIPLWVVRIAGLNVLFILMFAYLLQGLALVGYFFRSKGIPPALRGIGYLLIAAQQIMLVLLALLGLIDVWADFRKIRMTDKKKESCENEEE